MKILDGHSKVTFKKSIKLIKLESVNVSHIHHRTPRPSETFGISSYVFDILLSLNFFLFIVPPLWTFLLPSSSRNRLKIARVVWTLRTGGARGRTRSSADVGWDERLNEMPWRSLTSSSNTMVYPFCSPCY